MNGEEQEKASSYSWYALGVLFLVYLLNFVDRQILSILANDIKADLELDDAQLGFLYGTAFAIFYALFGIPLGRLADTWSRTRLLASGIALWSCMTALSGFARNFATLTVARIGVGVGEASSAPTCYSMISSMFPPRMRGLAMGIFSAGLFTGSGLSLLIGGTIVERWNAAFPDGGPLGLVGWQAAFLIVGLPGLGLALWVLSLREPPREQTFERPFADFARQVAQIVPPFTLLGAARAGRGPFLRNLTVAAGLALLAWALSRATGNNQQFWFWTVGLYAVASWAAHLKRTDPEAYSLTFGSAAFMGIVVAYGTICFLGYSVSFFAAPYAERTFELSKGDLGLLIGAPNGAAATQSLITPRMRGVATAIYLLGATLIGLSLGPFTAGYVSEMTGSLAQGVMATLAIVPVGLLATYVAVRGMPRQLERLGAAVS